MEKKCRQKAGKRWTMNYCHAIIAHKESEQQQQQLVQQQQQQELLLATEITITNCFAKRSCRSCFVVCVLWL